MLKDAQKATRGEGGFTLIELLVVMIIIAILMAVAVPTFLKQKQTAVATQAKANIKQVQTAIESCASSNTTGQINATGSPGGRNCQLRATIIADEASLANVIGTNVGQVNITAPAGAGASMGYVLTARFQSDQGAGTYVYENLGNGTINKRCTPAGSKACPAAASQNMW